MIAPIKKRRTRKKKIIGRPKVTTRNPVIHTDVHPRHAMQATKKGWRKSTGDEYRDIVNQVQPIGKTDVPKD